MQLKTQSTAQQGDVIIVTCWDKAMLNRRVGKNFAALHQQEMSAMTD